ncbi:MAG: amino acid permease, partial [Desulfomonilaceae bacterium]
MHDYHRGELKRQLGLFSATSVVVANMIGTGIFTTPGLIATELDQSFSIMFCWLLGGLFALSGALCYAELGVIYPQAGGEYAYLRERFGKLMGFLSGWISLIVGFSAPIAAASVTLASYVLQIWAVPSGSVITLSIFGIPVIILSLQVTVAVFTILMLSFIHYCGVALGSKIQNVLTSFKIIVIVVFIVSAFFVGQGSMSHFSRGWNLTSLFQDKFAVSLIFVSFSYSGWNAAAYLGSEIKKPDITLPISLIFGTSFVIVIYLLLNLVYIYSLP